MIERIRAQLLAIRHYLIMGAMFVCAAGLGVVLLPGEAERIAMLERDGLEREVIRILEQRFATGDRRLTTLLKLAGLYEAQGSLAKARQVLELVAEQRPRDAQIQARLAGFYKVVGDQPAYRRAMSHLIDLRYAEPACRELVGVLRLAGDYAEEQATLQRCRQKGYRRTEDLVRLAQLLSTEGDTKEAAALLRGVDDLRRLKSERERLLLFSLLLDGDQPRDALRRAVRWNKTSRDAALTLTLIEMLVRSNRREVAIELAREAGAPGDRVSLAVAEIMNRQQQHAAARSYLRGWLEAAGKIDQSLTIRFIEAALEADDAENAYRGAARSGLSGLPTRLLTSIAEGLAVADKRDELADVAAFLAADDIAGSQILTAVFQRLSPSVANGEAARLSTPARSNGNPPSGPTLPAGASAVDPMTAWRQDLWARLARDAQAARKPAAERSTAAKVATLIRQHKKARRLALRLKARPPSPQPAPAPAPAPAATNNSEQ